MDEKNYTDQNTRFIAKADPEFGQLLPKYVNCSLYGKQMEDLRK